MTPDIRTETQSLPQTVELIVEAALDKKASRPVLLDLRGLTDIADFFFICSADADPHALAISGAVDVALKPVNRDPWHIEGKESRSWILIDFVDVVVHIFRNDARDYYALEEVWADAPRIPLLEPDQDRQNANETDSGR
jgi:ribosome-associated protein